MKALTISQPFASLIASGEKWAENRNWHTSYRGPLAIHAGKGTQYLTASQLRGYPTGCIIAVAEVVACLHIQTILAARRYDTTSIQYGSRSLKEIAEHKHTQGPYCWVLDNVRPLPEPVNASGHLGLWDAPKEVRDAIERGEGYER